MNQHHQCHVCRRNDVRLYRAYGMFLRNEDIRCNAHIPRKEIEVYVPLVEDDKGMVWGYTSVPSNALERWHKLPDRSYTGLVWQRNHLEHREPLRVVVNRALETFPLGVGIEGLRFLIGVTSKPIRSVLRALMREGWVFTVREDGMTYYVLRSKQRCTTPPPTLMVDSCGWWRTAVPYPKGLTSRQRRRLWRGVWGRRTSTKIIPVAGRAARKQSCAQHS